MDPLRAAALIAVCLSVPACSSAGADPTEHPSVDVSTADKLRMFSERGISFGYPSGWTVTGFSTSVSPARLVVASYALPARAVEGDCGGLAAVEALPDDGALVILIDYGQTRPAEFPRRPSHLRLADGEYGDYECFGAGTMFRFRVGGRALQAHVVAGPDAVASRLRQALAVLDSIVADIETPAAVGSRTISLSELALHPNRWTGRRVVVEGHLYKFPGDQVSSAKVQDQLVCDRIERFPPGGRGTYCIAFWGVRVQDLPGARRSPDGGWVRRSVRLAGSLHAFPYPGARAERVGLAATSWQLAADR